MIINKILFIFKLFLLFLTFIQDLIPLSIIDYTDEVLLIISISLILLYTITNFLKRNYVHISIILLFLLIVYSIINYFISPFSDSFILMFIQIFASLKSFIILFGFLILYSNLTIYKKIIRLTFFLFIIIFIFSLLFTYIFNNTWYNLLGHPMKFRDGLLRPIGHLVHPGNMGDYFIMTAVTLVSIHNINYIKKHPYIFFLVSSILIYIFSIYIFTVRKPILMIFPMIIFLKKYIKNKYYYTFFSIIGAIILAWIILGSGEFIKSTERNLEKFVTSEDNTYIRGLMFYHSINYFHEMFPIGTSPATFGSNLSQMNSLKAYKEKGIANREWLYNEHGRMEGVFDTGIGSLLAEYGFIGIILVSSFIYYLFKLFKKNYPEITDQFLILLFYILINTVFSSGFMRGYMSCFFTINVLYLISITQHNQLYNNR